MSPASRPQTALEPYDRGTKPVGFIEDKPRTIARNQAGLKEGRIKAFEKLDQLAFGAAGFELLDDVRDAGSGCAATPPSFCCWAEPRTRLAATQCG